MICPHCEEDTPATEPYCVHCGESIDLEFETVAESVEVASSARAVRETEQMARGWLLTAITALLIVLLARALLVPKAPAVALAPVVIAPADPAATSIAPLPIPDVSLEIPKK